MSSLSPSKTGGEINPRGVTANGESRTVVPVTASRSLARFNAIAAFKRISQDAQGFILEGRSPEHEADRFVYVGAGDCERLFTGNRTGAGDVSPERALRRRLAERRVEQDTSGSQLPFMSGAVGYFGYEAIRRFEPSVGELPVDTMRLPESAFYLPDRFVVYDRAARRLTAIVLVDGDVSNRELAQAKIESCDLLERAAGDGATENNPGARLVQQQPKDPMHGSHTTHDDRQRYEEMVRRARVEIERGELIQAVISQRVMRRTDASPLDVYAALTALNPSPYMFFLNFGDFALVGSSPELMVRSRGREVSMHPIAGTRPRGETPEQDAALEAELLLSEKERAEHVMLVDLARNDLGRVCEAGSVNVGSFMVTERYSHVMHLVSRISGRLSDGSDGLDAFVAGFPLGTLTGAPRLRAVKLIAELEQEGRGPYCGGVGWFGANGDVDTGTVIRCIVLRGNEAHVQGGGGIVFDSDPEREYLESVHKMKAQFAAIEAAEAFSKPAESRISAI